MMKFSTVVGRMGALGLVPFNPFGWFPHMQALFLLNWEPRDPSANLQSSLWVALSSPLLCPSDSGCIGVPPSWLCFLNSRSDWPLLTPFYAKAWELPRWRAGAIVGLTEFVSSQGWPSSTAWGHGSHQYGNEHTHMYVSTCACMCLQGHFQRHYWVARCQPGPVL